jgi:NADH-quinone oxidoreductase subunit N
MMTLLVVGGLNTVVSLFYYLRVVRVMTIEKEPEDRQSIAFSDYSTQGGYILLLTIPTALLILNWDDLNRWALAAAQNLLM